MGTDRESVMDIDREIEKLVDQKFETVPIIETHMTVFRVICPFCGKPIAGLSLSQLRLNTKRHLLFRHKHELQHGLRGG